MWFLPMLLVVHQSFYFFNLTGHGSSRLEIECLALLGTDARHSCYVLLASRLWPFRFAHRDRTTSMALVQRCLKTFLTCSIVAKF